MIGNLAIFYILCKFLYLWIIYFKSQYLIIYRVIQIQENKKCLIPIIQCILLGMWSRRYFFKRTSWSLFCTLNKFSCASSSNIIPIKNCLRMVEKLHVFFNTPKRNNVLQNEIEKADHPPNITTFKRLCATRWVQRHDALNDFYEV